MSKKQLIVMWVIGCIIAFMLIAVGLSTPSSVIARDVVAVLVVSSGFFIIGSLLIYTLRDKEK